MRRKGEGSIYQLDDGRWVAQLVVGRYDNGRPRYARRIRQRHTDALAALRRLHNDHDAGITVDGNLTVAAYLDWWSTTVLPGEVTEGTEDDYRDMIRLHLKPRIGRKRLSKLTRTNVAAMMTAMGADGLSARTAQYARAVLRRALTFAVDDMLLPRNVAAGRMGPTVRKRKGSDLTGDEARAVLHAVRGDPLEALAHLVLTLGLRQGEALSVFWPDARPAPPLLDDPDGEWSVVDLDDGTLTVASTLKRRKKERGGGKYVKTAKSDASIGTLPLVARLPDQFRARRRAQAKERLAAGEAWADTGLVFTRASDGQPLDAAWVTQRWWDRVCRAAGLGHRTFHATRHTCATLLLDDGVPLEVVSAVLRHANLQITADIYARVTADLKRRGLTGHGDVLGGR